MKKNCLMYFPVFMFALAACQNDADPMEEGYIASTELKEITSCVFQVSLAESPLSRTAINDLRVEWNQGDKLGLFCGGREENTPNVKFTVNESGKNASIKSEGDMTWQWDNDTYVYGYYPYSENSNIIAGSLYFELPDEQVRTDEQASQLSQYDYLVAAPVDCASADIKLNFQHIMTWLDFSFTNTGTELVTVKGVDIATATPMFAQNAKMNITKEQQELEVIPQDKIDKLSVAANGDWATVEPDKTIKLRMAVFPCDLTGASLAITVRTDAGNVEISRADKNLQMGKRYTVEIPSPVLAATNSLTFESTGGDVTLDITSNMEWDVTAYPDWVEMNLLTGKDNAQIVVTAKPNAAETSRTGKITLQSKYGKKNVEIEVIQAGSSHSAGVPDQGEGGSWDNE